MSKYIATRASRGAQGMVSEADRALSEAIATFGPEQPVVTTSTSLAISSRMICMCAES